MKKQLLFIINPKSGTQNKEKLPNLIHQKLNKNFHVEIAFTQYAHHATSIAQEAVQKNSDIVVAVGGDGTVNEIAKALLHSPTALAILPTGSGNGLARHLGFSLDIEKNIENLLKSEVKIIDACSVNEFPFFCTSGMGFDAHISYVFAQQKRRGLWTYAQSSVREFWNFRPENYQLSWQGKQRNIEAFMLTFANAQQFGNNAFIAPKAQIDDGLMDICITQKLNFWTSLRFNKDLFLKNLDKNPQYESFRSAEVFIQRPNEGYVHYDGEAHWLPANLHYKVLPKSLRVYVGEKNK